MMSNYYKSYHAGVAHSTHIPAHGGTGILVGVPFRGNQYYSYAGAGTLGCLVSALKTEVKDGKVVRTKTDRKMFLSAHHVLYPNGRGLGESILNVIVPSLYAPQISSVSRATGATTVGPFLAVPDRKTIYGLVIGGALTATGAYYDVGIGYPTVETSHYVNGIGIPTGHVEEIKEGLPVKRAGGTLGVTRGVVTKVGNVSTTAQRFRGVEYIPEYKDVVLIRDMPPVPGDSGALVVEEESNKAVGIFCCGYDANTSIVIPARRIANTFLVSFEGDDKTYPAPPRPEVEAHTFATKSKRRFNNL